MIKMATKFEPKPTIVPEYRIRYTSVDGEQISLSIGELFHKFSRDSRDYIGKGALFQVRGQSPEPIRGKSVYERLLRELSIRELEETARDRADAETFRTTIETLLRGILDEQELNTTAA